MPKFLLRLKSERALCPDYEELAIGEHSWKFGFALIAEAVCIPF
jgi:hypothetical protein